jgi:DNA repair exonuclease SbcCD ATPase subunit
LIGIALGSYGIIDSRLASIGAVFVLTALLAGFISRPGERFDRAAAPAEIDRLLGGLRIAAPLIGDPDGLQRLVHALDGISRLLGEARVSDRAGDAVHDAIERREREWAALCRRIGADPDGGGDLLIARLRADLEAARAQDAQVRRDRALRDEAKRLCDRDTPLLGRKSEHRRRLETALRSAQPDCDSPEEAFERVHEQQAERDFLVRREVELREDSRFAAFEADARVAAPRAPEDAPWLPEVATAREAELRRLEERIGAEQRRLGELSELLGGDTGSALARATDTVREIEDKLETVERERDRLALLDSILGRAEREFRESHQPDVLRRASVYLDRVTLGRYRRIDLLDEDRGQLCVTPVGRSEPVAVGDPISQGTLDQIFFCLRLGMLDHLDEDRERLPLVLDDALLRMDDARRRAVYDLLGDLAPLRQVFLLTCHDSLAEEIAARLKVRRIDL